MVSYVTPEKFRVAGTGLDLSGIEDVELVSILTRASNAVNSYCSAPQLPQPHDFRGGTVTGEQHIWNLTTDTRRFYPWHQPIIDVEQFRIYVTEGNYVEVQPTNMFTNVSDGYVEIVALTLGIGVFPVVSNLQMSVPIGTMNYTYGRSYPVVGETLYETDGNTFRAQHQFWADDPAPVVYVNGVIVPSGITINASEGTVVFDSDLSVGETVTADYTYTLPGNIADATTIIAAAYLGERNLAAKGMYGLLEVQVAEVRLRRPTPTALLAREASTALQIPPEAGVLLAPYVFRSVGG